MPYNRVAEMARKLDFKRYALYTYKYLGKQMITSSYKDVSSVFTNSSSLLGELYTKRTAYFIFASKETTYSLISQVTNNITMNCGI